MRTLALIVIVFATGLASGIALRSAGHSKRRDPTIPAIPVAGPGISTPEKAMAAEDGMNRRESSEDDRRARDPFTAWESLLESDGAKKDNQRDPLLREMAKMDGRRAWEALTAGGRRGSLPDLKVVAEAWGGKQGYAAALFGLTLTDPIQRSAFMREALSAWMAADRVSFSNWMRQQPASLGLDRYIDISRLAYGGTAPHVLTLADLDMAVAFSPTNTYWGHPLDQVFEKAWADAGNRANAAAWISSQSETYVRDSAWRGLALETAKSDLGAAAEMAPQIQNDRQRHEVMSTIAARLAMANPQEAFAYTNSLADDASRKLAWQSAFTTWAERDPQQALSYVRANPEGIEIEDLSHAARFWGISDPTEALATLASIAKPQSNKEALASIIQLWQNARPLETMRWLESDQSAILPAQIRDRFIRKPASGGSWSTESFTINGRRVVVSQQ